MEVYDAHRENVHDSWSITITPYHFTSTITQMPPSIPILISSTNHFHPSILISTILPTILAEQWLQEQANSLLAGTTTSFFFWHYMHRTINNLIDTKLFSLFSLARQMLHSSISILGKTIGWWSSSTAKGFLQKPSAGAWSMLGK